MTVKIDWIRIHHAGNVTEYQTGGSIIKMEISSYSTEPFCGRTELRMQCAGDVVKVRSLDGVSYDYQTAKEHNQ